MNSYESSKSSRRPSSEARCTVRLMVVVFVGAVACGSVSAQRGKVTPMFKTILEVNGLGHLSPDDMNKVEDLLVGMNRAHENTNREKTEGYDSIVDYMKAKGYTPEMVTFTTFGRTEVVIVGRVLRYFTTDVPFGLSSRNRNGIYFVRAGFGGGISELIADGETHMFFNADWKILR